MKVLGSPHSTYFFDVSYYDYILNYLVKFLQNIPNFLWFKLFKIQQFGLGIYDSVVECLERHCVYDAVISNFILKHSFFLHNIRTVFF